MGMKKLIWKDVELINQLAEKHNYNRQVDIKALKKDVKKNVKSMGYKDFHKTYFAARAYMIHEHKNGWKCESHIRIGIWFPGELENNPPNSSIISRSSIHITLDCDLHLWDSLETLPSSIEQWNLIPQMEYETRHSRRDTSYQRPQFTKDSQLALVT